MNVLKVRITREETESNFMFLEVSNGNKNNNNDPKADKEKSGPLVIRVSRKTPLPCKETF